MNKFRKSLFFVVKLIVLYLIFYGLSLALIGVSSPAGKLYIPFIAENLNLVEGYRMFLLHSSGLFARLFGYETALLPPYTLAVGNSGVTLVYSCMGYGLMSVWLALILAYPMDWKRKGLAVVGGLVLINLLNILRIGGLAMLYSEGNTELFNWIDHHTLFNSVVYIVLAIYFYLLV
jgi:exosortase/archaeosortase family protein